MNILISAVGTLLLSGIITYIAVRLYQGERIITG
jgi:hypothetical protein